MELLDDLRLEHDLIGRVLGALRTYAPRLVAGQAPAEDGFVFLQFLETYAGHWHHEREEGVLFPALVKEALLPGERGPIAVLLGEHDALADRLSEMRHALCESDFAMFERLASDYTDALWCHIDAENSVLFPESERQLRRNGVHELPSRPLPAEAANAAAEGLALTERYPPSPEADTLHGEGCVVCPSYGTTCRGLEREWWNQWEWEELEEHVAAS